MNSFLLSLGVAIVLALVAALVGPYFVDWSDYRADVEARISKITGSKATIGGELEIRFLPTGRIGISGLEIQRDEQPFPILIVPELSAEFSLAAFLSGRIEILNVKFTQPIVSLTVRENGSPAFGTGLNSYFGRESIAIGEFTVTDGTLVFIEDSGNPLHTLSGIEISGNAETLAGPIRLEGEFDSGPARYAFRLGTGRVQADGGVRTKLNLTSSIDAGSVSLDVVLAVQDGRPVVDGTLAIDRSTGNGPAISGNPVVADDPGDEFDDGSRVASTSGRAGSEFPWKLTASIRGGIEDILLQDLKIEVGAADRAVSLEGTARAGIYPETKISAILSARQLDLDRAMGGGLAAGETVSLVDLPGVLNEFAGLLVQLEIPVDLSVSANGVLLGGNLIEDLNVDLTVQNDRVVFEQISAELPGGTDLFLAGTFTPGQLPVADSVVRLSSNNGAALAAWMGIDRSSFGPLFAPGRRTKIEFEGGISTAPDRIIIRDTVASIDGNRISGGLSYPLGNNPGDIEISLDFGALDLDQYVPPESVARELGGSWFEGIASALLAGRDMAIQLTAETLSSGDISAEGLDVNIGVSGDVLTVHQLNIASLSGASFTGQGQIEDIFDEANGSISTRMEIENLIVFLPFMETLFGVASITEDMATMLSPISVDLTLSADSAQTGSTLAFEVNGDLAGTIVALDGSFVGSLANFAEGRLAANLNMAEVDGQKILGQLGLGDDSGQLAGADTGLASFNFALEGRVSEALAATAALNFIGTKFDFSGSYFPGDDQELAGNFEIASTDVTPLLELFGLPKAEPGTIAASLKGYVAGSFDRVEVAAMTGRLADSGISGDLNFAWADDATQVDGDLTTDVISMPWILDVFLGDGTSTVMDEDHPWPATPFDVSSLNNLTGEVSINAGRAMLGRGIELETLVFNLEATDDQFTLSDLSARHGNVNVAANVTVRDSENGQVAASMRFKLDGGTLENYLIRPDGEQYASGPFRMTGQVAGSGRSWRGIVASLSGDGAFQAGPGEIARLDPGAFASLLADTDLEDGALELTEAGIADSLGAYLGENPLAHDGMDTVFSVSGGILRARNAILVSGVMPVRAMIEVDFSGLDLESRWEFAPLAVQFEGGDTIRNIPNVTRRITGPLGNEEDEIDVAALTTWLGVRRMEKNLADLERARADVREQQAQEQEAIENLAGDEQDSGETQGDVLRDQDSEENIQSAHLTPTDIIPDPEDEPAPEAPAVADEAAAEPEEIEVSELPEADTRPVSPAPGGSVPLGEIVPEALRDVGQAPTSGTIAPSPLPVSPTTEIPSRQTEAAPALPPPTSLAPVNQPTRRSALVPPRSLSGDSAAPVGNNRSRRPSTIQSPEGAGMMN